jgi:hypothetical protein
MLNSQSHELSAFQFKRIVAHRQGSLDRLGVVKLNIGNSLASSTSGISDDPNISNFAAVGSEEEVPNIFFFSF